MVKTLVVGQLQTNCYLVDKMIIDPGDDAEYIMSKLTTKPKMIIATHGHFDHLMAAYAIQKHYHIPVLLHPADVFLLPQMQSSARHWLGTKDIDPAPETTEIRDIPFINTPGHTPGSICLTLTKEKIVFCGDLMFADGAVGRTDFSYSSKTDLEKSIEKVTKLYQGWTFYPGHGPSFIL